MRDRNDRRAPASRLALASAVGVALLAVAGCDGLLDVELPGDLTEEELYVPESAEMIVNSAIADYECAYTMFAATMSGAEDATWKTSGYFTTSTEYQTIRPGGGACTENSDVGTSWFQGFQKTRLLAEEGYEHLQEWSDEEVQDRQKLLATAATYAGLAYTQMGENYCEYATHESSLMSPSETLGVAEDWFTTALNHVGGGDFSIVSTESLRQLALLARARVRLAMGDHAGAAADAEQIQPGFRAWVTRDASVRPRWNQIHQAFTATRFRTVAGPVWWYGHDEDRLVSAGYHDLTISPNDGRHTVDDGVPDPRVPVVFTGEFAQDGVTDQYNQLKYTSLDDDHYLATWEEAQLILAEIEGGQGTVERINAVRDQYGLPHFQSDDEDEIFSALVEERRRQFFMDGRHHADKLRYGLWFPRGEGWNHKQVRYGLEYCLLMPEEAYELNEEIPAGYTGPDLGDPTYTFELEIDREVSWPVPSSLD